jgi:GNAT superfamily N-acetyltransferase
MLAHFQNSIIHDKHGKPYSVIAWDIDSEIFRRFNIEHRGCRIGYVNYHVESDDVLFIDDLRIDDKAMRPPWFFIDLPFWIGSLPPERWRVTNYQKRGIGTAMIEFLKSLAKSESLKRIEGDVKHHDFNNNPDLPNWYRRRGFTVRTDNISAGVAKISLTI